jgi:hypothetical protein
VIDVKEDQMPAPYHPPTLTELGTVQHLTLGASGPDSDGVKGTAIPGGGS